MPPPEPLSVCGKLADHRGLLGEGCVNVDERGVISSITKLPRGVKVERFEAPGVVVAPGLVDLHVHLRGLRLSYKEDERSGTMAAAASGITLVADMPNTLPRLSTPSAVEEKLRALSEGSYVDYAVYAAVPDRPGDVEALLREPVVGFKVYPEDLGLRSASVSRALDLGRLVVLHPELPEAERVSGEDGCERSELRGCWMESASVYLLARLGRGRVHVTHASCPSTVRAAKELGMTVDVTPHHLFFSCRMEGCYYKVNPPLRDEASRAELLKLLVEGAVDALASDHAPHSPREKDSPATCPPGFPWLGAWPWLVFRLVRLGVLPLARFLYLTSYSPARILGLKGYGELSPGSRANLVAIDMDATWRFAGTYSKARYPHVFLEEMAGAPVAVYVGGELVARDGAVLGRPSAVNAVLFGAGGTSAG